MQRDELGGEEFNDIITLSECWAVFRVFISQRCEKKFRQ